MLACLPTAVLKTKERQLLPTCCTCAIRHHQELKPQQLMLSFMKHCASKQSPYVSRMFVDYSIRKSSWTLDMQKRRYFNNNSNVSSQWSHYFSFCNKFSKLFQAILFLQLPKNQLHIHSVSYVTILAKFHLRNCNLHMMIGELFLESISHVSHSNLILWNNTL